jgi:hypothetical protein
MNRYPKFEDLVGKTLTNVSQDNEMMTFECSDGSKYQMYHGQDCCERVYIEDITDGWKEILNEALVIDAYESSNRDWAPPSGMGHESYTWTFYRITTNKGCVVIRWFGESNGYYSEGVSFYEAH